MSLASNLGWSVRLLRRSPFTTGLVVLILSLAIGAATAVFSVVSGVLLRPLPFSDPGRLVVVHEVQEAGGPPMRTSAATYRDWRTAEDVFDGLTLYTEGFVDYVGGERPMRLESAAVGAGFFQVLGVPMARGRGFLPEDEREGAPPVAVVSHQLWQTVLGGDPRVVGRQLRLGDERVEVVGVAPRAFDYPADVELWRPIFAGGLPDWADIRGARFVLVVGRLRADASLAQAETRLAGIMASAPDLSGWTVRLQPLRETLLGDVRTPLLVLLGAVIAMLLVGCTNVSSILLARLRSRRRELAVRRALGAGRGAIAGLLLTESAVLALFAGAGGVLLALWGADLLVTLSPRDLPETAQLGVDWRVLGFALAVTLAAAGLSSLTPVLRARRVDISTELEASDGRTTGRVDNALWHGLIVAQVALTAVLLVGGGLLVRSFLGLMAVDPGLEPTRVITFHLHLPEYRYASSERMAAFQSSLLARVRAVPGVDRVALARNLPLTGRSMTAPVVVEGRSEDRGDLPQTQFTSVTPAYFEALGIRLLEGRRFETTDDADATPVAIVSVSFARTFFPSESAVGKRARTLFGAPRMREIVGVVEDVKHLGPEVQTPPTFYAPHAQMPIGSFSLVVRSDGPVEGVVEPVRTAVWSLDPELPVAEVVTMERLLADALAEPRFYATLVGGFAALALILASAGIYGVLAAGVNQRRRELGVRIALGAALADVVGLVLRQGVRLTAAGLLIGLLGALGLTRLLAGMLFELRPSDPLTYVGVAALLLLTAGLASWIPARRAAGTDPAIIVKE